MQRYFGVISVLAFSAGLLVGMAPLAHAAQFCGGKRATIVGTSGFRYS